MLTFTIGLAGVDIAASVFFETTRRYCAYYLTDAVPTEHVTMSKTDLTNEREHAAKQDISNGRPVRAWTDEYLEPLAFYRKIALALLPYNAIVFHGSVVALDGRAYLFTAPSGTGKTTHTRYWLSQVPGSYVLNGDKPLLRMMDGEVFACGTPWQGKEHMGVNECLPLAGLCVLERGKADSIRRIDLQEALPALIGQAHRPQESAALVRVVELVGKIGTMVPLWHMSATLDERSALVSHDAMAAEKLS